MPRSNSIVLPHEDRGVNVANRRILLVVSSVDRIPGTEQPTGVWLEELAASYNAFLAAGFDVSLASPKGGRSPIDPMSQQDPWLTEVGKRFMADSRAQSQVASTESLRQLDSNNIDAIYLVGGLATVWDFLENVELSKLVTEMHARGKAVGAVCHGVLGLTTATEASGQLLVKGRRVTGVSNEEEKIGGLESIVPVTPQNRLTAVGADYSCGAPFQPYVVADGHLFTGQNPASAGPLAKRMIGALQ
jgi:putative intracellular protease/amidase